MGNIFAELAFAEVLGTAGIFNYFVDSNMAGKCVIFVLALLNCWALSIMFSKSSDLKIRMANARDEKRINELSSMMDYEDANFAGQASPYLRVCSRAMAAAHAMCAKDGKVRINYVEKCYPQGRD